MQHQTNKHLFTLSPMMIVPVSLTPPYPQQENISSLGLINSTAAGLRAVLNSAESQAKELFKSKQQKSEDQHFLDQKMEACLCLQLDMIL